jgi:hypothetical protein
LGADPQPLNPLRAGLVKSLDELDRYEYAGHSVIMGRRDNDWQDTAYILRRFGRRPVDAKRHYRTFVAKGIKQGHRPDFTGGGLIRSVGGWTALKALRKAKVYTKGDERILGDSDFVQQTLDNADEQLERKYKLRAQGYDIDTIAKRVGQQMQMPVTQVLASGKNRQTVRARSLLCYWAVKECGMTMVFLSRKLGISPTAVSQSVERGGKIAFENSFGLMSE